MNMKKFRVALLIVAIFFTVGNFKSYAANLNPETGLPNYYTKEWLNGVYSKYKKTASKGETSFAFITDTNLSHNSGYSTNLAFNISKQKTLDFVVNGGNFAYVDQATTKNTTEQAFFNKYKNELNKDYKKFLNYANYFVDSRISPYYVKGNHDLIVRNGSTEYNKIRETMKHNKYTTNGPKNTSYYYFDDTKNKIRYFVLDVNENPFNNESMSLGQIKWFCEKLAELKNYKVVVFTNAPVNEDIGGSKSKNVSCIQKIEEAYNNCKKSKVQYKDNGSEMTVDFTKNTSIIIAHISGKTHRDKSIFKNNVLSITTTADYYTSNRGEGMWDRKKGTTTEQAFDIMTIDTKNNKLYATRVGAGKDREWKLPTKKTKTNISSCTVKGVTTKYSTGKAVTLGGLSLTYGNKKLTKDTDYTVAYSNNTKAGVATVTIKGKGNYTGTVTKKFRIIDNANIDTKKEYYVTSTVVNGMAIETPKGYSDSVVTKTLNCGELQRLKFIKNSDGTYYIQNVKLNKCIYAYAEDLGKTKINLFMCNKNNESYEKWYIGKNSNGTITFYTSEGLAVEIGGEKNNSSLILNTVSNNKKQQFKLRNSSDYIAVNFDTGFDICVVQHYNRKKALDVYGSQTANGTNVDIYDLNKSAAQIFRFTKNSDGTFTIVNKKSKKALDVYGNKITDGANVDIYTSNKTTAQKWYIIRNNDFSLTFLGAESGRALDLAGGSTKNFNNVQLMNWNEQKTQKWNFVVLGLDK